MKQPMSERTLAEEAELLNLADRLERYVSMPDTGIALGLDLRKAATLLRRAIGAE